ncbi:MAG: hypothetical protein WCK86_05005 [Planctomycetia bacterium]
MDPQAAWNEMLTAILQKDWEQVSEFAEALLSWMKRGGFPPQTTAVNMTARWNRAQAEFGGLRALRLVKHSQRRNQRKEANE